MRVVSLLPAATEIVAALGGIRHLVGISYECDFPASVGRLPRVTATPIDVSGSSAAIDAEVRQLREAGRPVIGIDAEELLRLRPDLILTQGLCEVCAVAAGEVHRLSSGMSPAPSVLSLCAGNLDGIWRDIQAVGRQLDLEDEAVELVLGLQSRLRRLRTTRSPSPPRVICVEWLEPLYLAGHWVPEMVDAAGGVNIGCRAGTHSARSEWRRLTQLRPDHIVVMLCGFGVERAIEELEAVDDPVALDLMARVPTSVIDGNQYTSRPGPRVVDGAARLQWAITGYQTAEVERWRPQVRS